MFKALIDKEILFDDLYTGFMIKISRFPKEAYNRDIILYLVMFGYKYKNSKKIVKSMKQLIIFGSGDYAKMIFHELKKDKKYKILGFFDERKKTRFLKVIVN